MNILPLRVLVLFVGVVAFGYAARWAQSVPPQIERPVRECQILQPAHAQRSTYATNTWAGGIVPYTFATNISTANQQSAEAAIAEIEAVCGVDFIARTTHTDYIRFTDSTGNNSHVGRIGGGQVVNIYNWNHRFIIVHELMHALGFYHEQQRPDRDNFVQVYASRVQAGVNFNANFGIMAAASVHGAYDFDSVMHYDQCAFSACCPQGSSCGSCTTDPTCEVIAALPPFVQYQSSMGQRTHLSDGDINGLRHLYPESRICTMDTVAYWSFDSDLSNRCSDPRFDGSLFGTASINSTNAAPIPNNSGCLVLNGNPSRVNFNGPLPIGPLPQGTIESWVYLDTFPGPDSMVVFNHGVAANSTDLIVGFDSPAAPGSPIRTILHVADQNAGLVDLPGLELQQWHHVAWTWDGAHHRFYLDGTLVATLASTATPTFQLGNESEIGSDDQEVGYFIGRLDDIRISRRALDRRDLAGGLFWPPCRADIVSLSGSSPPDGHVGGEDFLAFMAAFFGGGLLADVVGLSGSPPPDGRLGGEDFLQFLASFFGGC